MLGYVLVDDMFDEMIQNISYIKLNNYLKERKNQFSSFFVYSAYAYQKINLLEYTVTRYSSMQCLMGYLLKIIFGV